MLGLEAICYATEQDISPVSALLLNINIVRGAIVLPLEPHGYIS